MIVAYQQTNSLLITHDETRFSKYEIQISFETESEETKKKRKNNAISSNIWF